MVRDTIYRYSRTAILFVPCTDWILSGENIKLFIKIHFEWIMSKIDKLKVVKIVRQQFASNDN